MSGQKFGAVVFDYDGTLCDAERRHRGPAKKAASLLSRLVKSGVAVGVATGRGDSARAQLAGALPKGQHARVLVGYHNCSEIGSLADAGLPADAQLHAAFELINGRARLKHASPAPRQISVRAPGPHAQYFTDLARDLGVDWKTKAVESDHSVDLLPPHVSKLPLYDLIRARLPPGLAVLCIGDGGGGRETTTNCWAPSTR